MADIARIEERLDRVAMGATEVSDQLGGIAFQNMTEVMEFSKLMSLSGNAVPRHLQGNPGMCLAVCVQAMEWRFSPFAVANKSYEVQSRLSFESQLVHAVIEQRAPIVGRLRHRFEGEGDDRICIVWATLRETSEVLEYRSPAFSKIQPKNSPLWKTKPDLQQYYNTSRDFCRAYFPDVLLGVYSHDELRDHVGPDNAKSVGDKPNVADRLKGSKGRGFSHQHVERESRGGVIEEPTTKAGGASQDETPHHATRHEQNAIVESAADAHDRPDRIETVGEDTNGGGHEVTATGAAPDETSAPTVSNSPEPSQSPQSEVQATPATEVTPLPQVAGNLSEEESSLAVDWRETYLTAMRRVNDRPKSLVTRHAEAIQLIGGKATVSEQEWMRAVYRLTERRLKGEITIEDFTAAVREIA